MDTPVSPSASKPSSATAIVFQDWEARPIERMLVVRGEPVVVGARAFDVLMALIDADGDIVRKGSLLDSAWHGLIVEENNVSVQIAALRKVLGAKTIATVAGIGYRLSAARALPVDAHAAQVPASTRAKSPHAGVPLAAALVGRHADLETVTTLVATHPLVTIVGTGGVGKTALAKAVVANRTVTDSPPYWMDLSSLRETNQLVAFLGATLGVDFADSSSARVDLLSALADTRALIVLDNCEHLIDAVADLVSLALETAPALRWLATSQERLRLAGEAVHQLEPLGLPEAGDRVESVEAALRYGAVALLGERAAAGDRRFRIDPSNVSMAIEVCRRLDGLPLAIEMAAALISSLGLEAVHRQLGHRLSLRSGSRGGPRRHHTLQDTFEWSHDLLSPAARQVFRRLEPFVGGFGATMAEQLAHDDAAQIDAPPFVQTLGLLIDKSLVHRGDVPGRYYLYESMREFAAQKLAAAGETRTMQRRHAEVLDALYASAPSDHLRLADTEWTSRYLPERQNLRSAVICASHEDDPDLLARLVAALSLTDNFVQSQPFVIRCDVPLATLYAATPAVRAAACVELSWVHYADGNRDLATELSQRALEAYRVVGDVAGEYRALAQLVRLYESRPGLLAEAARVRETIATLDDTLVPLRIRLACTIAAPLMPEGRRTIARLAELESQARRAGFASIVSLCHVYHSDQLLVEGRFDDAIDVTRAYLDADEARPRLKALLLTNLALALIQLGRIAEASQPARAALRVQPGSAFVLIDTLALAAARTGQLAEAATLAGYGMRARRDRDVTPDAAEAAAIAATEDLLMAGLSSRERDELSRAGAALSMPGVLRIGLPDV